MTHLRRTAVLALVGLMLGFAPSVVLAQQAPDREYHQPLEELIRTEVVFPQEKGEVQLTTASLFDHARRFNTFGVPLEVEYGVTDSWQVGLEWTPITRTWVDAGTISEVGAIAIGTKYSFMNIADSRSHAAAGVELALGELEVEPFVVFARDLNARGAQMFAQLGLGFASSEDGEDEAENELEWNAGAVAPVGPIALAAEINVRNHSLMLRGVNELYFTPSVTFRPAGSWEVGCGIPIGLTSSSTRVGLAVLVTFEQ